MKVYHRWLCAILTIGLTVAAAGCLDSQAMPTESAKPRQAFSAASATTVALPSLANRLAFTREGALITITTDGTDEQIIPLTLNVSGKAAWAPEGDYLALADEADGGTDIFILPLDDDGTPIGRYNITHTPNIQESSPAWSPEQHSVAYGTARSGNWGIYVMEVGLFEDYREPMIFGDRRVSQHNQSLRYKGGPIWSPDGTKLSYTSDIGSRYQITSVEPYSPETVSQPGTEIPVAGTNTPSSAVTPCWSPDGSRLVYSANPNGNWDLFIVAADGGSPHPLTTHSADDWHPAWSPDGTWIAFTSNRSFSSDIYLITPDGSSIAQLTKTLESEDFATWLPLQSSEGGATP